MKTKKTKNRTENIIKMMTGIVLALAMVMLCASSVFAGSWQKDDNGWWYRNDDGSYPVSDWKFDGNAWYHFDGTGYMDTGWVNDNGTWYFMNQAGDMATGWVNDAGTWYFMNPSGDMATGWVYDGGNWYFMLDSGAMATGTVFIDGKANTFNENGIWTGYGTETKSHFTSKGSKEYAEAGTTAPQTSSFQTAGKTDSNDTYDTPPVKEQAPAANSQPEETRPSNAPQQEKHADSHNFSHNANTEDIKKNSTAKTEDRTQKTATADPDTCEHEWEEIWLPTHQDEVTKWIEVTPAHDDIVDDGYYITEYTCNNCGQKFTSLADYESHALTSCPGVTGTSNGQTQLLASSYTVEENVFFKTGTKTVHYEAEGYYETYPAVDGYSFSHLECKKCGATKASW